MGNTQLLNLLKVQPLKSTEFLQCLRDSNNHLARAIVSVITDKDGLREQGESSIAWPLKASIICKCDGPVLGDLGTEPVVLILCARF